MRWRVYWTVPCKVCRLRGHPDATHDGCYPTDDQSFALHQAKLLRTKGFKPRVVRVLSHEESKRKAAAEELRAFAQELRERTSNDFIAGLADERAAKLWPEVRQ